MLPGKEACCAGFCVVSRRLSFSLVPPRYFCMRAAAFDSFVDALK